VIWETERARRREIPLSSCRQFDLGRSAHRRRRGGARKRTKRSATDPQPLGSSVQCQPPLVLRAPIVAFVHHVNERKGRNGVNGAHVCDSSQ